MTSTTRILVYTAVFCTLIFLFVLLWEYIVARIAVDYNTLSQEIASTPVEDLVSCKRLLCSGDILVILSPVHFVDTACHAAMVLRDECGNLAVLDTRKAWRRNCSPRFVTFEDFLSPYETQPYRLMVRQIRDKHCMCLKTDRLREVMLESLTTGYDSIVACQQINRWIGLLGDLVPRVPQPEIAGRSYCSRALLTVLVRYGAIHHRADVEQRIMGPIEWAVPPSMSNRRFPPLSNFLDGYHVCGTLMVNMERGLRPTNYLELTASRWELQRRHRDRLRGIEHTDK